MNRLTHCQQKTKEETVQVFPGDLRIENGFIPFLPQRKFHPSATTFCVVQYIYFRYSKKHNKNVNTQVFGFFNCKEL